MPPKKKQRFEPSASRSRSRDALNMANPKMEKEIMAAEMSQVIDIGSANPTQQQQQSKFLSEDFTLPLQSQKIPLDAGSDASSSASHSTIASQPLQSQVLPVSNQSTQAPLQSQVIPILKPREASLSSQVIPIANDSDFDDEGGPSSEEDEEPVLLRVGSKRGRPSLTLDRSRSGDSLSQAQNAAKGTPKINTTNGSSQPTQQQSQQPAEKRSPVVAPQVKKVGFKSPAPSASTTTAGGVSQTTLTSGSNTQSTSATTASNGTNGTPGKKVVKPTLGGGAGRLQQQHEAAVVMTTSPPKIVPPQEGLAQAVSQVQQQYHPSTVDAPIPATVVGNYMALSNQGLQVDRAWVSTIYTVANRALGEIMPAGGGRGGGGNVVPTRL